MCQELPQCVLGQDSEVRCASALKQQLCLVSVSYLCLLHTQSSTEICIET